MWAVTEHGKKFFSRKTFESPGEAQCYAMAIVREYREIGMTVTGSAKERAYVAKFQGKIQRRISIAETKGKGGANER